MLEGQEVEHGTSWAVKALHCEQSVLGKVGYTQA